MTSPQARKGGNFERSVFGFVRDELGPVAVRPRVTTRDVGDLHIASLIVLEAKCYTNLARAVREGLAEVELERVNAGLPHGAAVVKRVGTTDPARQLVVQELGSAVGLWREALA